MKYNDAFLAITEDGVQTSNFYCSDQTKWFIVKDNSFYYVERHLAIHSSYGKMFRRSKSILTIVNQNKKITFSLSILGYQWKQFVVALRKIERNCNGCT